MFNELDQGKKIPELEEATLKFWKDKKIFDKSVNQRSAEDLYVFYDGPPFISGLPHPGHLLASVAKDLIPRYWTMKGKRVERVWGWDAHGLTVESKVQKELGIKNRRDIESYGLEKFTTACYKYTSETSAEWPWYIDKIGRWVDMENAYKTIDAPYMESVMWAFKQLYDKGLIYEGVRTSLYCTTCGTPVSNFEVAMDNTYKDVEDPAVTVKFKVTSDGEFKNSNILAWTTTPWTLPSNRALVVASDETYIQAKIENEIYIVAQNLAKSVFENQAYSTESTFLGKELIGLAYEPLYTFFAFTNKEFKVYSYEGMANVIEGTGIVHSAPGFGEVDTEMGMENDLTVMLTIDNEGKFIKGNNGINPFEGMFYIKANKYIREDLKERNLLFKDSTIVHRFPYHDRCNTNLIQRAQNSWFINVADLKEDLIKNNQDINWVPAHLKHNRFEKGIEQAPDWCISRSRFWATPMPVWEAEDGSRLVVGSIKELEELSGQRVKDLHRPFIDEITIEKDGKVYKRLPEVLDSWFEAGSMPYASIHYPFENKDKFESHYPGDYIVEYIAQTRAWFYVMHVLSTALFESNSFKNVIGTGVMAGNDGRKMSKTYGNYTDPKEILNTIGGDALRLFLMNSPLMLGDNANFDDQEIKTKSRRVLNPLLNSANFLITYANANNWLPSTLVKSTNLLDKWVVVRLHEVIKDVSTYIEDYNIPPAVEAAEQFVDDLSRWYVRRSRDRISSGDEEALSTLYYVLREYSKAVAPIVPFIAEAIYQNVVVSVDGDAAESVHLELYPNYDVELINSSESLLKEMEIIRDIASLGNALRVESSISVRQPLNAIQVVTDYDVDKHFFDILKDELNVKNIEVVDSLRKEDGWISQESKGITVSLDTNITEELRIEGLARAMVRTFQELRKKNDLVVSDVIEATYEDKEDNEKVVKMYGDEIRSKILAESLKPGNEYSVFKKA
ncbi:MAG: isoleucine--tRNA ligase [Patescibacteria group bacterium]